VDFAEIEGYQVLIIIYHSVYEKLNLLTWVIGLIFSDPVTNYNHFIFASIHFTGLQTKSCTSLLAAEFTK